MLHARNSRGISSLHKLNKVPLIFGNGKGENTEQCVERVMEETGLMKVKNINSFRQRLFRHASVAIRGPISRRSPWCCPPKKAGRIIQYHDWRKQSEERFASRQLHSSLRRIRIQWLKTIFRRKFHVGYCTKSSQTWLVVGAQSLKERHKTDFRKNTRHHKRTTTNESTCFSFTSINLRRATASCNIYINCWPPRIRTAFVHWLSIWEHNRPLKNIKEPIEVLQNTHDDF